MRKILGYIAVYTLMSIGLILAAPTLCGSWLLVWANRLVCWTRKKHTYNANLLFGGLHLDNLTCTVCGKQISAEQEKEAVRNDYFKAVEQLKATKDYLNEAFKTPEEAAAEGIIEDTKLNG